MRGIVVCELEMDDAGSDGTFEPKVVRTLACSAVAPP